jgi:hypothetical protein
VVWDAQLEEDVASGKLDTLLAEVQADFLSVLRAAERALKHAARFWQCFERAPAEIQALARGLVPRRWRPLREIRLN